MEKERLAHQKTIDQANKDLETEAKIAETEGKIKAQRLKRKAERKALEAAAKKAEAKREEGNKKINDKKLSKRELRIMQLRAEIKDLGTDIRRKGDDLESAQAELKAIKEKGDVNDALRENILQRKIRRLQAEAKTLKEDKKEKQEELDHLLGVMDKKGSGGETQTNEDFLRELQAKAKRQEMEERRKQRAKNASIMAKAKREEAEREKEERIDFEYRVAEAERQAMKDKIKKAKEDRKRQKEAFMRKQTRMEAELDALAEREAMEDDLEEAERRRKAALEKAREKLLRQMAKLEEKAKNDAEFEKEVMEELEAKKIADDRRRRERKYLEEKKRKELEEAKKKKGKTTLTKDDERYISKEAKRRAEIADSLEKVVDKQKDEWTRFKMDAEKDKEAARDQEKLREEKRRQLREQRKIDAKKKEQLVKETKRLNEVLEEKQAMARKIEAAKRASMAKEKRRAAAEEIQKQMLARRTALDKTNDSLKMAEKLLADRLAPLQDGITSRESKIKNLENEILGLKSAEMPLLREFLQKNQQGKSIKFQAGRLAGAEKLDKKAEASRVLKEGLEVKLKVKENYLHRLGKDRQLNIYRQKINVLKERLRTLDTISVDEKALNRILLIQYSQIEKAIVATPKEMEEIIMGIGEKEQEHAAIVKQAIDWRADEKKDSIANSLKGKLSPEQLTAKLDSLKEAYTQAKPKEKDAIRLEMEKLYGDLPEGIHEEIFYESNRTIKQYVVSKGGEIKVYKMVMYSWGSAYYFKDGVTITKSTFDAGTKY